jgi:carbamoyl-phosphate synthase large subunit
MVVIEMNPRVSRSSALASKATGFPIAKVAAKLAVGYTLDELRNDITGGATPASFEPSIDYVVTKIPRFAFEKFPQADSRLTTQMKSVGEVMAMGRTFQESFQKALRGLEVGVDGMNEKTQDREVLEKELGEPGPERIWYVGDAFAQGLSVDEVYDLTKIDKWFLVQIEEIVKIELELDQIAVARARARSASLDAKTVRLLKRKGFSDRRLAKLLKTTDKAVRELRKKLGVRPVYKRVDTCAAEFATNTAYMYSTYEDECEAEPTNNKKIMVLGGGPNRIGQGIEFDYCCVHAALALREDGYETIMVNCNPETVSTDYDTSDRLYFEPLTLEDVLEIVDKEKPVGVIVQYGGQTPLKLALGLEAEGVPIIGTSPDMIDAAEDRERFQKLLQELGLRQPPNATARTEPEALEKAQALGYPLVVRPSYVLGGRAMEIVHEQRDLERYMREAVKVSNDSPVLLDRFLNDAIECDVDCLADGERTFIGGVMEHIEQAGVHSGDSACSLPPYSLSQGDGRRDEAPDGRHGQGAEGGRPDERAVRHPGEGRPGRHLRAGSEPARVAHRALREQGHRHPAGQGGGALHGGPDAGVAGHPRRSDAAVLQRQGSRVPVRQVPGRGHHPRPRDEVDRRGDGRGQDLRRGLRQEPDRRRHQAAAPDRRGQEGVPDRQEQ